MTELADGEARRRIATEFATTFFVEAAAGTGKTTALVHRIVGLISAGVGTLNRIVAVTFTEKVAGETKLNLRTEIEATRADAGPEQRDQARAPANADRTQQNVLNLIHLREKSRPVCRLDAPPIQARKPERCKLCAERLPSSHFTFPAP